MPSDSEVPLSFAVPPNFPGIWPPSRTFVDALVAAALGGNQQLVLWGPEDNQIFRLLPYSFVQDPDHTARCVQIETAINRALTSDEFFALYNFIQAEKISGRWALHRRIYLPIWGNLTANAIDLVTGESGTWQNGTSILHGPGFVQNTLNGYFDTLASSLSMGMSTEAGWLLTYLAVTTDITGFAFPTLSSVDGTPQLGFVYNGSNVEINGVNNITVADTVRTGIYANGRHDGTLYLKRLRSSGMLTNSVNSTGIFTPSSATFCFTGFNNGSVAGGYPCTQQLGLYTLSLGMSQTNANEFLQNQKTLWETCTNLILP